MNHREQFFQQLSQQRRPQVPDRAAFRQSWLENLQDLFDRIDVWLTPAKGLGLSVERQEFALEEEDLGNYIFVGRSLRLPDGRSIVIKPVAAAVVGALGRVDMICGVRRVTLLLTSNGWVVAKRSGAEALNEDHFFAALSELSAR